jgi:hypothetical protein
MFFLLVKNLSKRRLGYQLACTLTAFVLVISYSGTIVPFISLLLVSILFILLGKGKKKIIRVSTSLLFLALFFSWYAFTATLQFGYMFEQIVGGLGELVLPTSERILDITAYGLQASLTEGFQFLINLRNDLTILLASLAAFLSIYILFKKRELDLNATFLSSMFLATILQFLLLVAFVYYGVGLAFKFHTFFVYLSVLCVVLLLKLSFRYKNKVRGILGLFALTLLLLVPLLSYSTVPFLHTPSSELRAKLFTDTYYHGKDPILATELNLPYTLFGILNNVSVVEPKSILTPEEPIKNDSNYLILQRFMTRDGYTIYQTGYKEYLDILINSLSVSHNLIYTSGAYTKVFLRESP